MQRKPKSPRHSALDSPVAQWASSRKTGQSNPRPRLCRPRLASVCVCRWDFEGFVFVLRSRKCQRHGSQSGHARYLYRTTGCLARRYGVFRSTPDGCRARPSFLHGPSFSNRRRELGCWWAMCRPLSRQRVASDRRSALKLGRSSFHSFSFPPRHDGPGVFPPPRAKLAVLGIIHTFQVPGLLVLHLPRPSSLPVREDPTPPATAHLALHIPFLTYASLFAFFFRSPHFLEDCRPGHWTSRRLTSPPSDRPVGV